MECKDSSILKSSISKLLPFILVFSVYVFSFGANFPGGGFQAGLIFGTILIIWEILFESKVYESFLYLVLEFYGAMIMMLAFLFGIIYSGLPFQGLYRVQYENLIFSNGFIWLLNFAVFVKIVSALVLLFRAFNDISD